MFANVLEWLLCLLSMHKKSPIWSSILVSWGKLPTLKFTLFGQGKRRNPAIELEKKNNPKVVFAPSLLNNSRTCWYSEGPILNEKRLIKQQTKFHRSKNSFIQLFLPLENEASAFKVSHYFLSFLNICNTFILYVPAIKLSKSFGHKLSMNLLTNNFLCVSR